MELFHGYCIDTDALINLWRRIYPRDVFPSLWKEIENLIAQGRLIIPREVLGELENFCDKDDELLKWIKKRKSMKEDLDKEQSKIVKDILANSPKLIDADKPTSSDADPFLIALAKVKNWTVITSEKPTSPGGRPKIPDVCEHFGVKCIQLVEFFREQKWMF